MNTKAVKGFTLVELSIVIVIIGFLVAGIAAGANMVKQSQIRSVITDLQGFQTAFNNFQAKYNSLPGDMNNATSFWPNDGQCVPSVATFADDCNGNGNGMIDYADVTPASDDEVNAAMKHLSLAGMISAGIPVIPDTMANLVPGVNAPASKLSGVGYYFIGNYFITGKNIMILGKSSNNFPGGNFLNSASLKPEDALNIDLKIDDASSSSGVYIGATTGSIRAREGIGTLSGECVDSGNPAAYTITTDHEACLLMSLIG